LKRFFVEKLLQTQIIEDVNQDPILNISQNPAQGIILIDVANATDILRLKRLDGVKLLGKSLKFVGLDEKGLETVSNFSSGGGTASSAQATAQAAAVAIAALKGLQGQEVNLNLNLSSKQVKPSKIIKLMNCVDPFMPITKEYYDEVFYDMEEEFSKFGAVQMILIVRPNMAKIGAESGSIFIEYKELRAAEEAVKAMNGKQYDNRVVKIAFVDEEIFTNELKLQ